jgi:DNA polymerase
MGLPFVGQAGQLLDQLLGEIGLARDDVFIANVLKCRPPGNRDPQPAEIDNCQSWLLRQVELIEPKVICTLGNFSTKLLRGEPTGITRLHGRDEERVIGLRRVRLLPLFHPAAALYTASMLETLKADFARIPDLLALPMPDQPEGADEVAEELLESVPEPAPEVEHPSAPEAQGHKPSDVVQPDAPAVPAVEQIALF